MKTPNLDTTAEKTILTINDLQKQLQSHPKVQLQSLSDIGNDPKLASIQKALEITSKYQNSNALETIDPQTIREHLLILSALNINVAEITGLLGSQVQSVEDALKLDRAKTHLELKQLKETFEQNGQQVRASERDIEAVARVRAQDIYNLLRDTRVTSKYTEAVYFAIMEFGRVLQTAAERKLYTENQNVKII